MRFIAVAVAAALCTHPIVFAADPKPVPAAPAAAPAPAAKPVVGMSLHGKVTTPDGKPQAGATVRAIPMPAKSESSGGRYQRADLPVAVLAKTDAAGAFHFEGLTSGSYAVRVEVPGFAPTVVTDLPVGATVNLRLKAGTSVVGTVVDLLTQQPIPNATVTGLERDAARFGREAAHTAKTGDDGTFMLVDCAPGIIVVEAIAPAKARARLDHVVAKPVAPGEERNPGANVLFLQPGGRIAGRVLGPDGKPAVDAIVWASPSDGSLFAMLRDSRGTQRTDASGKFDFDGLAAGNKYTVRARKEGLAAADQGPLAIEAGTDRGDVELKLEAGANLAFRLVTAQDVPVKSVEARMQPQNAAKRRGMGFAGTEIEPDKIVSSGDGKFLIKALDAGTFDVTLMPPDFADVAKEGVKLKSGETTDLGTLRVKESKSIAGRITDTRNQPISGATISGMWLDGDARLSREARSGSDGRFRLSGLGDQPLRNLTVRAKGYADGSRDDAVPGDTAVDFTLEKTGTLIGRVLYRGGSVPPAYRVQAFPEADEKQDRPGVRIVIGGQSDEDEVFSDPTGSFRLEGVAPGIVTVTAKADGKAPGRKSGVKVLSDQIIDVGTLTLDDGRALRGRVVAAKDDSPIPGATVSLSPPQGFMISSARSNVDGQAISGIGGQFEISGLEARTYAIDATQPDYSPNSGRVEIGADADTDDFVIRLSRGGTITGAVRDGQKAPQVNAQILLTKVPMSGGPQTVSTGPDGRYTFEKIAPGEYMVIRAPTGGGPLMLFGGMKHVVVREGETTVHDLDESAKINLSGRVLKAAQPVASAMLLFSPTTGSGAPTDLRQSKTDADGRYQIGLDAAGAYTVVVASGGAMFGGRQSGIAIQVPDQPNPVVDVTMKAAGISGRVVNSEGKPVARAMVAAKPKAGGDGHGHGGMQDQTETDGTFLLEGLDPGSYELTVLATGYRTAEVPPVTVANDSDVPSVEVRLESGRTVRGRVIDANGTGIAGALVVAAPTGSANSTPGSLPTRSDVNGTFLVTAPADGALDLTAIATGFPPARAVSVQPQDGVDVVLKAPRPGHIIVRVVGPGGAVKNATIECKMVPDYFGSFFGGRDRPLPTGSDGTSTVMALAPGNYEVTAKLDAKQASGSATLAEGGEAMVTLTLP